MTLSEDVSAATRRRVFSSTSAPPKISMKLRLRPFLAFFALLTTIAAAHNQDRPASTKKVAGPNGGRVLVQCTPRAEFLVLPDRKVQITFLGDDGKAVAPGTQSVTVTAGDRAAPTKLAFTKSGNALVSNGPLPPGNDFPAVVQIKPSPEAKTATEKFHVNLEKCPTCSLAEYACTCEHD